MDGLEDNGYALVRNVLTPAEQERMRGVLGRAAGAGNRGLLALPEVKALCGSVEIEALVRPWLAGPPRAVRAIFFDKTPETNWLVPWHQDLTLALREQREVPGFGPWSAKSGIPHVQPPVDLLEQMLTVRLHLDAAGAENGALRVLPGTHRLGRLSAGAIQALRKTVPDVLCAAAEGDALLMRPLLLHASSRSVSPGRRRVLHLEFAGFSLPGGLCWHEAA